ncbi:MAG: insulinase family protein [Pseudohongiellaceae bacterium]
MNHLNPQKASTDSLAQHSCFELLRREHIDSLNVDIEEYRHRKTGAMHYHIAADNSENVFLVALRTVPMDSTGVAHILEHTALCGSRKYPVRDPFFMMIRRSLNTFMNAFTSSDWTAYPFASKNRKDFDNLLQVYLDAVFFARLDELDFAQEGHRLEFAEADNPNSELQYKGVVFNEMKGAMSSTNSVLWQTLCSHLFPTTTYHFNSGGEPTHIPDLSYQQLKEFYHSHYHPSNAVFMTYGDIPAASHHARFEELALNEFEALDNHISATDEQRYTKPLRVEKEYATEADDSPRTHVLLGWLLGHSTNLRARFEAQLLCDVLLDNSSSPLLKALETSALGQSPSPLCGLEDGNREMAFMAGLEGCANDATDASDITAANGVTAAVETLILDTLNHVAEQGVEQQQVEAALHQLELNQREIAGGHYPYGLQLILEGLSAAIHRGEPIKLLDIEPVLAELREDIKNPAFIPNLVRSLLLDNQHRVTLTLRPNPNLEAENQAAEKQRLAKLKAGLNAAQQTQIVERSKALLARQAQADDPAILPKVGLDDVPAEITEPQRQDCQLAGSRAPVAFYAQGTNGLVYQQIIMPLPQLDAELLEILPLYTSCLTELGIGRKDYAEVQAWQAGVSGGVSCYSSMRSLREDEQQAQATLTFAAKGLARNHEALGELLHATITELRLDESQRLTMLIEQLCTSKENSIVGQGHSLAVGLASSMMSPVARFRFEAAGLEGIRRLKARRDRLNGGDGASAAGESRKHHSREAERLLEQMRRLHNLVQEAPRQFLLIAEPPQRDELLAQLDAQWSSAQGAAALASSASSVSPTSPTTPLPPGHLPLDPVREQVCELRTTATAVNFCAQSFPTVPAAHPDNPVLHVLAGFMRNGFLHRAIREQGGAYGAGAGQDANSASFRLFSYRDPRLEQTLADFSAAVNWVISDKHQPRLLEEAILGIIAAMDKPASPAGEARQAYHNHLFGRSLAQRKAFRQQVLATTLPDLRRVAETWLTPANASTGIIASPETAKSLKLDNINIAPV